MADGNRANTLKQPGFIESSNVVTYTSCHKSLSQYLSKFMRLLAFFQLFPKSDCSGAKLFRLALFLLIYIQKQKNIKITNSEKKTYEKTFGGPIKRPQFDFVGMKGLKVDPRKEFSWTFLVKRLYIDP